MRFLGRISRIRVVGIALRRGDPTGRGLLPRLAALARSAAAVIRRDASPRVLRARLLTFGGEADGAGWWRGCEKYGLAAVTCCAMLASSAQAQTAGGEQLYLAAPQGWKVGFHDLKGNVEVTELLPPGQTLKDWSAMLTVQLISGGQINDTQEILKEQIDRIQNACEDIGAGPLSVANENGYETAMRAIACAKSKQWGDGELSLYKVLRGNQRVYIVSRSWRGPAFDKQKLPVPTETTNEWLAFMKQVVLCDSRDPHHPCPSDKSSGAAGR